MQSPAKELYRVFQPYRIDPAEFYAASCGCCMSHEDCERLAATPLNQLTVADLDRYAFKAITTWGNVQHFKHFLPRLLELTLDHYDDFNMPEVLLGKLEYGQWRTWCDVEQKAVSEFLMEFWKRQLTRPLNSFDNGLSDVTNVLGGLAEACGSIKIYLEAWLTVTTESAALRLAQFLSENSDEILTKSRIYLWGKPETRSREFIKWLTTDSVTDYMKQHQAKIDEVFPFAMSQLNAIRIALRTGP